ncbi:hypothetical protein NIES4073_72570 [Kalymmatonema gypsitolerans NIES-4073]|nr:hypothetical protein NIES4073_72570 [Scytonema sp. NIES-4073]
MATIKISELQPTSQFEKVSDADLRLVNGGVDPSFQLVVGGTSATTGAAAGGRIENGTSSVFTLEGGLDSQDFKINVTAFAFSKSSPV